jgi:hypothetical protein
MCHLIGRFTFIPYSNYLVLFCQTDARAECAQRDRNLSQTDTADYHSSRYTFFANESLFVLQIIRIVFLAMHLSC